MAHLFQTVKGQAGCSCLILIIFLLTLISPFLSSSTLVSPPTVVEQHLLHLESIHWSLLTHQSQSWLGHAEEISDTWAHWRRLIESFTLSLISLIFLTFTPILNDTSLLNEIRLFIYIAALIIVLTPSNNNKLIIYLY